MKSELHGWSCQLEIKHIESCMFLNESYVGVVGLVTLVELPLLYDF